jgi:hypothetical protein
MKAQKIRRQLGGSLSMVDDFPPKPRGMHWKRYERLRQQHDSAARRGLGMMSPSSEKEDRQDRAGQFASGLCERA